MEPVIEKPVLKPITKSAKARTTFAEPLMKRLTVGSDESALNRRSLRQPESSDVISLGAASVSSIKSSTSNNSTVANQAVSIIRANIIGDRYTIETPFGPKEIVYADYTASGRSLQFIEDYMTKVVAPAYANTHTEASATGSQTTHLREEARDFIRTALNAPSDEYAVLFTGSGSTAAIEKMIQCLGIGIPEYADKKWNLSQHIPENERPVVFISHYEHHSNELPWRESIARCVVIKEEKDGSPDLKHLEKELIKYKTENVPMIGSFSAGSNVTGIKSPVKTICSLLHRYGAYAFVDYAGVGPYVKIDMKSESNDGEDSSIDAAFFSPHKFIGGPGSSGLLVARRKLFQNAFGVETTKAACPGGGTIDYVSRETHGYSENIEYREDSGTPGILQSIRAGLAFKVKEMVGCETIENLEHLHCALALTAWRSNPFVALMGADRVSYQFPTRRVSIFSFNLLSPVIVKPVSPRSTECHIGFERTYSELISESLNRYARIGKVEPRSDSIPLHYNFVIALLNDVYGIQGRGGCSCAAPYGLDMFNISGSDPELMDHVYKLFKNVPGSKPGWARVNFNYFISKYEVAYIIEAVKQISKDGWKLLPLYVQDLSTGQFHHRSAKKTSVTTGSLFSMEDITISDEKGLHIKFPKPKITQGQRDRSYYRHALAQAKKLYEKESKRSRKRQRKIQDFTSELPPDLGEEDIWWLRPSQAEEYLMSMLKNKDLSQNMKRSEPC